jgi:hypothetical protein
VSKDTLRRLSDHEQQSEVGRKIIEKMLRGQDHLARHTLLNQFPNAADDDQRQDDADVLRSAS